MCACSGDSNPADAGGGQDAHADTGGSVDSGGTKDVVTETEMVTWNVDFTDHPLGASGGDTPNPITTTASGTTVSFTFPNAGTFGFHCLAHPTIMFGAVQVTQ